MLSDKIESEKKRVYNLTFDFLSNNNNNITKSRNLQQVADYTRYSFATIRKERKEKRTECFNNQTSRSQFSENLLTPVNS